MGVTGLGRGGEPDPRARALIVRALETIIYYIVCIIRKIITPKIKADYRGLVGGSEWCLHGVCAEDKWRLAWMLAFNPEVYKKVMSKIEEGPSCPRLSRRPARIKLEDVGGGKRRMSVIIEDVRGGRGQYVFQVADTDLRLVTDRVKNRNGKVEHVLIGVEVRNARIVGDVAYDGARGSIDGSYSVSAVVSCKGSKGLRSRCNSIHVKLERLEKLEGMAVAGAVGEGPVAAD